VPKVHVVLLEQQAFKVRQARQELRVREVIKDLSEMLDSKEFQVGLDSLDLLDPRDSPDQMDSREFQDSLVYQDSRVDKERKDSVVHRVYRVRLDHPELLVKLVIQAPMVHLVMLVLQDSLDLEVTKVFPEWPVQTVHQVTGAMMALEALLVLEALQETLVGLEQRASLAHLGQEVRKVPRVRLVPKVNQVL